MTRFRVLPWKMASEGATMLAEGLGGLRIKTEGSTYSPIAGDCIVNWGNGNRRFSRECMPEGSCILNPEVMIAIEKKLFFQRMQGHNVVPPFAFSKDEAARHLPFPIICRTTTSGADGAGIVIASTPDELVEAPLYTQLLHKTGEYRVHLGRLPNGEIELICAQKKRVGSSHEGPIWTGDHTFLDWCNPSDLPGRVMDVTVKAMELMPELDFGGFDAILNPEWGARVVEVNSAPMMTPETTRKYVEFINRYVALSNPPVPVVVEDPASSAYASPVVVEELMPTPTEQEIQRVLDYLNRQFVRG